MFSKDSKSKVIIKSFLAASIFLVLVSFFIPVSIWAVGTLSSGYRLSRLTPLSIDHSIQCNVTCKQLTTTGETSYFVPTKFCEEWDRFLTNKPADVSVVDCPLPACNQFTSCGSTCSYEGENYTTVAIGSQCWMQTPLKTRKKYDGSALTQWPYNTQGVSFNDRFSCENTWTNSCPGEEIFYMPLAALAAADYLPRDSNSPGVRGICPIGWRIPSQADYNYLGATTNCFTSPTSGILGSACMSSYWPINSHSYRTSDGSIHNNSGTANPDVFLLANRWVNKNMLYGFGQIGTFTGGYVATDDAHVGLEVRCMMGSGTVNDPGGGGLDF